MEEKTTGLYVVATDIGNKSDITLRAVEVLNQTDFLICEEYRTGSTLLKRLEISKPIVLLNEHNEKEATPQIIEKLLMNSESASLISDAGTPLFADPGNNLVWQCHQNNIRVTPVPGVSSIMTALMGSGVVRDKFIYYGFLPANKQERIKEISNLNRLSDWDIILLETPYRLRQILTDLKNKLGAKRKAVVAYKLTQPEEKFFWGTLSEITTMTTDLPKGEFVIILRAADGKKS
ncbi:MAG: 16S rRNA (cytidine(1402)-2'-O)-methyltransferase [Candidatus Cloacimonetes bacterium]|nr:16S rRNA (cytidine(1402)-2'-O)-methyltransferase [Candidatus Cloacimonadota bacterium]